MPQEAKTEAEKKAAADAFVKQYIEVKKEADARKRGMLLAKLAKQSCIQLGIPLRIEENTQQRCDLILRHIATRYPDILFELSKSQDRSDGASKQVIREMLAGKVESIDVRMQGILKFPAPSRFFSSFFKERGWVKETAQKLKLLRTDMSSQIKDEDVLKKGGMTRYKQVDNQFMREVELDILKECKSQSELITRVRRYLLLAKECLKLDDPISAARIVSALQSAEIRLLTQKGSKFRKFLDRESERVNEEIEKNYPLVNDRDSNNFLRFVDGYFEKVPSEIRDSLKDRELVEYTRV